MADSELERLVYDQVGALTHPAQGCADLSSESILRILRKESADEIVWAPRLEQWYEVNRFTGNLSPSEQR